MNMPEQDHFFFTLIEVEQLPEVWRMIRDDVIKCLKDDTDDCLPEDVYFFLKTNMASLHVCMVNQQYMGFCILQRRQCLYTGRQNILIWLCRCKERQYTEKCFELIKEQAKESGCTQLSMKTPKPHLLKLMQPLGFEPEQTELVCKLC